MKNRVIVSNHDAALNGFHTGDFTESENIIELNRRVYRELFAGLVLGVYPAAVLRTWSNVIVYTRSTRAGVAVQGTVYWDRGGEWVPLSHHDCRGADDLAEVGGVGRMTIYESVMEM